MDIQNNTMKRILLTIIAITLCLASCSAANGSKDQVSQKELSSQSVQDSQKDPNSLNKPGIQSSQSNQSIQKERISSIISEYRGSEGFEIVSVGSLGTSIMKKIAVFAAATSDDEEAKALVKTIKGIKKIAVIDYEDCKDSVKEGINRKMNKALSGSELLMEIKDNEDNMKMYGVTDENGSTVRDFVMFSPGDCTIICLFGSIPFDEVMRLAAE